MQSLASPIQPEPPSRLQASHHLILLLLNIIFDIKNFLGFFSFTCLFHQMNKIWPKQGHLQDCNDIHTHFSYIHLIYNTMYIFYTHCKCLYRRLKLHHIAYWKFPSMNLSLVSNEYLSNCPYRKSLVTLSQPPDKIYVLVSFTSAVTTNIQSQHHHPIGQSLLPKRSLCSHWLRPQIRQH